MIHRLRGAVALPLAVILGACGGAAPRGGAPVPARYLYVWAGTAHDSTPGLDLMTVLDADSASPGYGTVIAALTVDSSGVMPHHTEFAAPDGRPLFANDYTGDKSFLVDFSTPRAPRLAARLARVPGGRRLHSFARLANGHVLATIQFSVGSDSAAPGEIGRAHV